MASPESLRYFAFSISIGVGIFFFVAADFLWKKEFLLNCLLVAAFLFIAGILFEIFHLVDTRSGIAAIIMAVPMIYLGWFSLLRFLYKRRYQAEPHITSRVSRMGGRPEDLFSAAEKNGKYKKYPKGRAIIAADFVFSILQALAPAFTILGLIMLLEGFND